MAACGSAFGVSYTVTVNPTPGGTVTSVLGINCTSSGGTCSASVPAGTTIFLIPAPDPGFIFANWYGGGCSTGTCAYTANAAQTIAANFLATAPELPRVWVDNNECNAAAGDYEYVLGAGSWTTGPPPSCSFSLPYADTTTGAQAAVNAIEACRTQHSPTHNIILDFPSSTPLHYSAANGLVIPQSASAQASTCIILRSDQDSSLPLGSIPGSHGIQDNLSASTDIGLHNPDTTGQNMYYELGTAMNAADAGSGAGQNCVTATMSGTTATFTLTGGAGCASTYPASFTPGNIINGNFFICTGCGTTTALKNQYRTDWTILSGGATTASLTAKSCSYAASPTCLSGLQATSGIGTAKITAAGTGCVAGNLTIDAPGGIAGVTSVQATGTYSCTTGTLTTVTITNAGAGYTTSPHATIATGTGTLTVTVGTSGQLLTQWVTTGITTVSANATTLVPITVTGTPVLVPLSYGYVSPGVPYCVDGESSPITPVSGTNQVGIFATFTTTHAFGIHVKRNLDSSTGTAGCGDGSFTLADGSHNVSAYDDLQYMWQVTNSVSSNGAAISGCTPIAASSSPPSCTGTVIGPDHWLIEDVAAQVVSSGFGTPIIFERNGAETAQTQYASHIHLRKDWAGSDWTCLFCGSTSNTSGISFTVVNGSIGDTQISQIMRPGSEGHAISYEGTIGKFYHLWIEGASSGFFTGGYATATGPSSVVGPFSTTYVPGCDTEFRDASLLYPFTWMGLSPVGPGLNPNNISGGQSWSTVRKIAIEEKELCRSVFDGIIAQTADLSGGSYALARAYNTRNCSSGLCSNYQATIHDVTDSNNIYRHACLGASVARSNGSSGEGGGVSFPPKLVSFLNDAWYDIGDSGHPWCASYSSDYGIAWDSGHSQVWGGNFDCDTTGYNCTFTATTIASTGAPVSGIAASGHVNTDNFGHMTWVSGNVFDVTWVNVAATVNGVSKTILSCSSTTNCQLSGINTIQSNVTYSVASNAVGFQALDMAIGDPASFTGCTQALLNSPTATAAGNTFLSGGYPVIVPSALWNGTWSSANTTIMVEGNPTLAGLHDDSGTCQMTNLLGSPQQPSIFHNTLALSSTTHAFAYSGTASGSPNNGPPFSSNMITVNNIIAGGIGWKVNPFGEGFLSIEWVMDLNSLTNSSMVWQGRASSAYAGAIVGNNPVYPLVSAVNFFPAGQTCATSPPNDDPTCVGFQNNTGTINPADYHGLGLVSGVTGSYFASGNAGAANDGSDNGVSTSAIDMAETLNQYVCPYSCGAPGPYPDVQALPGVSHGIVFGSGTGNSAGVAVTP